MRVGVCVCEYSVSPRERACEREVTSKRASESERAREGKIR